MNTHNLEQNTTLQRNITLRTICDNDADFLFLLLNHEDMIQRLGLIESNLDEWKMNIQLWAKDPDEKNCIIMADDHSIGWCAINNIIQDDENLFLKMMVMKPGFQGQSISQIVLDLLVKSITDERKKFFCLYTDKDNENAIKAYRKFGFSVKDEISTVMTDGQSRVRYRMEYKLP